MSEWFTEDELDTLSERLAVMPEWRREALLGIAARPGGADELRRIGLTKPATGAQLLDHPIDVAALQRTVRSGGKK